MIAQGIAGGRRHLSVLTFLAVALLALAMTATAGAAVTRTRGAQTCAAGSKPVTKVVRKHGRTTVIRGCKRKAPAAAPPPSPAPASPAPTASASSSPPATDTGAPVVPPIGTITPEKP